MQITTSASFSRLYFSLAALSALLLVSTASAQEVNWTESMRRMYERYPSSRVITDPQRLQQSMKAVDPKAAQQIRDFIANAPEAYDIAREAALKQARRPTGTKGHVVISGGSASGATAARVFSEAGYSVDVYESRANPTRLVQWGARQSLLDSHRLYFGRDAGDQFMTGLARDIGDNYKHIEPDGAVHNSPLSRRSVPSTASLTNTGMMSGSAIVGTKSVAAVEVAEFEKTTRAEIQRDPNIRLHLGESTPALTETPTGNYAVGSGAEPPKFVIIAEGAGSKTAKSIGIERVQKSPSRLQVAGVIHTDIPGGNAVGADYQFPGTNQTIVSGSLHQAGSGKVWLVTDLDAKAIQPGPEFTAGTPEFDAEKARLVEQQYRQTASRVLNIPPEKMAKLEISGATGGKLMPFELQLGLSQTAVKGNAILIGDTVGNGHWAVGAGGMIANTAHQDALANYLNDIERGVKPEIAKKNLNTKLRGDSEAWIRAGISKMYPELPAKQVQAAYDKAMSTHSSSSGNFRAALDAEIAKIPRPQPNAPRTSVAGQKSGAIREIAANSSIKIPNSASAEASTSRASTGAPASLPVGASAGAPKIKSSNCVVNALEQLVTQ